MGQARGGLDHDANPHRGPRIFSETSRAAFVILTNEEPKIARHIARLDLTSGQP